MRVGLAHARLAETSQYCSFCIDTKSKIKDTRLTMSTSTKSDKNKELPIYDPEGLDPEANPTFEEVQVPLQEHVTNTRRAVQQTLSSVQEAWVRVTEDTRKSLTSVAGKTRRQTNATLSSLGLGESTQQVLRGSVYAGAALTGLFFARKRSLFIKTIYPLLGVGLVGGAIHRQELYTRYRDAIEGSGLRGNWSSWKLWKGGDTELKSRWRKASGTEEEEKEK